MPYCSIEEAWGSTFSGDKNKPKTNYRNIVPDNANNNLDEYADIDFENDNVYTKSGKPILCKGKKKRKKRRKTFSRTMNRLPDSSGPNNRYIHGDNYKQLQFGNNQNKNSYPTKSLRDQTPASYDNVDVPISNFNKDLEQKLYNELDTSNIAVDDNSSSHIKVEKRPSFVEQEIESESDNESDFEKEEQLNYNSIAEKSYTYSDNEIMNQEDKMIKLEGRHINRTNQRRIENYKDLEAEDLEKDRVNKMRNNMFDIIVYVITGIFLIFILDLFVRLGKNSRS